MPPPRRFDQAAVEAHRCRESDIDRRSGRGSRQTQYRSDETACDPQSDTLLNVSNRQRRLALIVPGGRFLGRTSLCGALKPSKEVEWLKSLLFREFADFSAIVWNPATGAQHHARFEPIPDRPDGR